MRQHSVFIVLLSLAICSNAFSSDSNITEAVSLPELISEIQRAEPIERVDPYYPRTAARMGQEGWVQLSFVVSESGEVLDPVIIDSSGVKGFERAALSAVEDWVYAPAKQGDKPIQQCENYVQIDFTLQGTQKGVRTRFARDFKKIQQLIVDENYDAARVALDEFKESKKWNLHEVAYFYLQESKFAHLAGDKQRFAKSVDRLMKIGSVEEYIGKNSYLTFKELQISQLLKDAKYASAIKAFDDLKDKYPEEKSIDHLVGVFERVDAYIQSDNILKREGEVTSTDYRWSHRLLRQSFSVRNVNGVINDVEVRCQNKRHKYTFAEDAEWRLPATWGECSVLIDAEEGATFSLVELPNIKQQSS